MKYLPLLGRILFASIFLISVPGHFKAETAAWSALQGVPIASFLVPFSGILELIGAISVLIGYKTTWGALLLVVFMIPVTFMLHAFWKITDPMQAQMGMVMFLKNISIIGAALFIAYFGPGPFSVDNRTQKAAA